MLDGQSQAMELFNASPALFVQNQGQWADTAIRYGFDGAGGAIAFRDSGLDFVLYRGQDSGGANEPGGANSPQTTPPAAPVVDSTSFSIRFDGANVVAPVGQEQAETTFNYLLGDQADWRSNVPAYSVVSYLGVYDGIDLRTWGKRTGLKYEFDVAPGADYRRIQVHYDGIDGLSVDAGGALHIQTALGDVVEQAPLIYQEINGQQVGVAGGLQLINADTYSFTVTGPYDATKPLILDPDLAWFTYLGGSSNDEGLSIALDSAGNAYVTGYTDSSGLATAGACQTTKGGNQDAFVAKVNATGSGLAYFTYLGGTRDDDEGRGIAVDTAGNAYVTGNTNSSGLATAGAGFQA